MKKTSYLMLLALPGLLIVASFSNAQSVVNFSNVQSGDSLVGSYIDKIDELLPGMGQKDLVSRKGPQMQFEKICFESSGPGKENNREALCKAIIAKAGPEIAKPARVWLLRKLEPIGGDEVVKGLVVLMHDKDAQIRELARRALKNNPSKNAAAALRTELADTKDGKWRVALINALGFRRDAGSLKQIGELARDKDLEVAAAAIAAMGKIGNAAAAATLKELQKSAPAELSDQIVDSLLRSAENMVKGGARKEAANIYMKLLRPAQPERIRMAALHGLTKARGVSNMPRLLKFINGDDAHMRITAARCAIGIPGSKATSALAAAMTGATADVQILLLDALAQRRDQAALPAVVKMLENDNADIRLAVLDTIACVGNGTVVKLLAERVSATKGKEREAVRKTLASIPGQDVDRTILETMAVGDAPVRAEIIRAAAARRITDALPKLYNAAADSQEEVRTAVALALGTLAPNEDFPKIVDLLKKADDNKTLWATEIALTEICLREGDQKQRTKVIVDLMPAAKPDVQASMIRVLAKIGGQEAFNTILAKYQSSDQAVVKNSAVRTLSAWKAPVAIDPVWKIVKTTDNKKHRQQALRGYVRLVRLPSERKTEKTYEMLAGAMKFAVGNDDKALVLAGMGEVAHIKALNFVLDHLDEPALQEQASAAVLRMAVGLSGWHRDEAIAAIERVRKITKDDKTRAEIQITLDAIKKHIVAWQMSGPFKQKGKKGTDLFDMPLAPEKPQADAKWKPLAIDNMKQPGLFTFKRGREQCAYFKSSVYSEKEQKALLVLGSDDGVKVWLNGAVVHGNNVSRGLNCEEDKIPVTLKKGWNPLMLKVINGGGSWGFCCAVKAPDESLIDGLKFKAE